MLTWKVEGDVDTWHRRVATERFTLYRPPHDQPSVLIDQGHEYNITEYNETHSTKNITVTTVTLWLLSSDNVLSHVPYVFCKVFRDNDSSVTHKSPEVFLQIIDPTSTTTLINQSNDSVCTCSNVESGVYTSSSMESGVYTSPSVESSVYTSISVESDVYTSTSVENNVYTSSGVDSISYLHYNSAALLLVLGALHGLLLVTFA